MLRSLLLLFVFACLILPGPASANVANPSVDDYIFMRQYEDGSFIVRGTEQNVQSEGPETTPFVVCSHEAWVDFGVAIQWASICACICDDPEIGTLIPCEEMGDCADPGDQCLNLQLAFIPMTSWDTVRSYSLSCMEPVCSRDCKQIVLIDDENSFFAEFSAPERCDTEGQCPEGKTCHRVWWSYLPLCFNDEDPGDDWYYNSIILGEQTDPCQLCYGLECGISDDPIPCVSCGDMEFIPDQKMIPDEGTPVPFPDADGDREFETDQELTEQSPEPLDGDADAEIDPPADGDMETLDAETSDGDPASDTDENDAEEHSEAESEHMADLSGSDDGCRSSAAFPSGWLLVLALLLLIRRPGRCR